jgi:uncharacterized membrane protein
VKGGRVDVYGWAEQLESDERLDELVALLDRGVPDMLRAHPWRERLAGTWLGHALHPLLTDFPLGLWTSASVLDVLGPHRWRSASTTLTGLGVLAAVPTAATGAVEWLDADPRQRRVAAAHATINSAATGLYLLSFLAKVSGRRRSGVAFAIAGGLTATAGGYLGGHLSYGRGVRVDHTTQQRAEHRPRSVLR